MDENEKEARWHDRFMGLCNHIAAWSEDRDFRVGAVVVGPAHEVRTMGYNGLPRGVKENEEVRFDRKSGEKFFWFEHAERNAIYNAARMGVSVDGCTIYVNRFPCADCARAIIQSGLRMVCVPAKPVNDGVLDKSFDRSEVLLSEAAVEVLIYPE
ncbi:deaminase [Rhizobium sp. S153]|uniref:Deaminase n=1 Tax=Ciceribacter sichuanensis TaxID=2949647 RepID=A0ABT0V9C3_9HYPH|nr:deaminase [Ciceribacter sp. S153]MCM2402482.1 deaminase [Ciceribacter sp. S153]